MSRFSIYHAHDWSPSDFDTGSKILGMSIANAPRLVLEGIQQNKENKWKEEQLKGEEEKRKLALRQQADETDLARERIRIEDERNAQTQRQLDQMDEKLRQQGELTTAQIEQMKYENTFLNAKAKAFLNGLTQENKERMTQNLIYEGKLLRDEMISFVNNQARDMARKDTPEGAIFSREIEEMRSRYQDPKEFAGMFYTKYQHYVENNPNAVAVNPSTWSYEKYKRLLNEAGNALKSIDAGKFVDSPDFKYNGQWLVKEGKKHLEDTIRQAKSFEQTLYSGTPSEDKTEQTKTDRIKKKLFRSANPLGESIFDFITGQ